MEIKTKLDLNDACFFMMNNQVCEAEIKTIETVSGCGQYDNGTTTTYTINKNPAGSQYQTRFSEDEIFATKQDLLDSL